MADEDPWLAPDKFYHVLFCLSLTLLFCAIALRVRYPFVRRHSILIASVASLFSGAAKEAADELGIFRSAGASAKDAIADIVGVLTGALVLLIIKRSTRNDSHFNENRGVSMV